MPGAQAIHLAAIGGSSECVQLLVMHGVSMEAETNSKDTPLAIAAFYGRLPVIRDLLTAGARVEGAPDTRNPPSIAPP